MTRTNAHTVLCMVIRAFAALAAVRLLLAIPAYLDPAAGFASMSVGARLFSVGAPLVVVAFMWLFPDWLAKAALTRRSGEVFETDIDARACLAIALAIVGACTMLDALLDSARLLFLHMAVARAEDGVADYPAGFGVSVWTALLGFLLGAALLLGSRGISALVFRIRFGDLPPAAVPAQSTDTDQS